MRSKITKSGVSAEVCSISWERIHLRMELAITQTKDAIPLEELDVFAVDREGVAGALFDTTVLDNGNLELYVNITNNGLHQCVPVGTYRIFVCHGEDVLAECETSQALTGRLEDDSRGFLYGGQRKEYTVNFFVEDDSEGLPFRMHMMHLSYAASFCNSRTLSSATARTPDGISAASMGFCASSKRRKRRTISCS